jgi:hypothetical protein
VTSSAGAGPQAPSAPPATPSRVTRSTPGRLKYKPDSVLAARAATEYRYVDQDLKRIALLGGALFAILILLFLIIVPLDPFGIY